MLQPPNLDILNSQSWVYATSLKKNGDKYYDNNGFQNN